MMKQHRLPDFPHLTFRPGRGEADYAGIFAIHMGSRAADQTDLQPLEIYPDYGFGSEAEYQERVNSPGLEQGITWAAWHGDQVVGTVLCEIARGRGAVEQFGVVKEWRRRGIGTALLVRALRALEKQGVATVRVHTTTDNAFGSRALYESVGFRRVKQQGCYRKPVSPLEPR
jgi:ribosomal protein S18 acetylase RimI-like enzyme